MLETKGILALIYRDYMSDEDKNLEFEKIKNKYEKEILQENKKQELIIENQEMSKDMKWYEMLKKKIKQFFNRFIGGEKR